MFTLNDPVEYERPVPAVVVAVHVGTPFTIARVNPLVPAAIEESVSAAVV